MNLHLWQKFMETTRKTKKWKNAITEFYILIPIMVLFVKKSVSLTLLINNMKRQKII